MRAVHFAWLAAMLTMVSGTAATADDPNDPAMRSAAAWARDRAIIRKLNLDQAAYVRERDARYAAGWAAYGNRGAAQAEYAARQRADERAMARWRAQVAACRAGDCSACD